MTKVPTERLDALRAAHPEWIIARAPGNLIGYVADRGPAHIYSPHLTGLAAKLAEVHPSRLGSPRGDGNRPGSSLDLA